MARRLPSHTARAQGRDMFATNLRTKKETASSFKRKTTVISSIEALATYNFKKDAVVSTLPNPGDLRPFRRKTASGQGYLAPQFADSNPNCTNTIKKAGNGILSVHHTGAREGGALASSQQNGGITPPFLRFWLLLPDIARRLPSHKARAQGRDMFATNLRTKKETASSFKRKTILFPALRHLPPTTCSYIFCSIPSASLQEGRCCVNGDLRPFRRETASGQGYLAPQFADSNPNCTNTIKKAGNGILSVHHTGAREGGALASSQQNGGITPPFLRFWLLLPDIARRLPSHKARAQGRDMFATNLRTKKETASSFKRKTILFPALRHLPPTTCSYIFCSIPSASLQEGRCCVNGDLRPFRRETASGQGYLAPQFADSNPNCTNTIKKAGKGIPSVHHTGARGGSVLASSQQNGGITPPFLRFWLLLPGMAWHAALAWQSGANLCLSTFEFVFFVG